MITSFFVVCLSAMWLGIMTSISPCPLASNIAAVSYIGRSSEDDQRGGVFLLGLSYTIGRALAYSLLGALLIGSIIKIPEISNFLQKYMNIALGPILILVGMFLLEMITLKIAGFGDPGTLRRLADKKTIVGAFLLGMLFSLSFCPVSAAFFFGGLLPLAVKYNSFLILPSIYGIGTALPVILFAVLIAFGTQYIGKLFNKMSRIEKWVRMTAGIIFIVTGIYYTLIYIFRIKFI